MFETVWRTKGSRTTQRAKPRVAAMMLMATALGVGQANAATVTGFLSTPTFDSTRTTALAQAGWGFYVNAGQTATINSLGFWVSPADSASTGVLAVNHTVTLYKYNGSSETQIAQAIVPAGSTGDANGYAWVTIPEMVLTSNGTGSDYYIITASMSTDVWGPNTGSSHTTFDSSFNATPTGRGIFSNAAPPGNGNTLAVGQFISGVNGGYIGPNFGYVATVPTPEALPAGLAMLGIVAVRCRRR